MKVSFVPTAQSATDSAAVRATATESIERRYAGGAARMNFQFLAAGRSEACARWPRRVAFVQGSGQRGQFA